MVPIGVDVHKRRCKVVEFSDSKVKVRKPMENTREEWLELLAELPPDAEIALEVSTAGYFAMSVLEEAGWGERAHWVHTAGIDSPRKQKYDRLDAERLARKLAVHHLDPLPEACSRPRKSGSCVCGRGSAAGWRGCGPRPRIVCKVCWRCTACSRREAIPLGGVGEIGWTNKSCPPL